jgi:hypothetical protein
MKYEEQGLVNIKTLLGEKDEISRKGQKLVDRALDNR